MKLAVRRDDLDMRVGRRCVESIREQVVENLLDPPRARTHGHVVGCRVETHAALVGERLPHIDSELHQARDVYRLRWLSGGVGPREGEELLDELGEPVHLGEGACAVADEHGAGLGVGGGRRVAREAPRRRGERDRLRLRDDVPGRST